MRKTEKRVGEWNAGTIVLNYMALIPGIQACIPHAVVQQNPRKEIVNLILFVCTGNTCRSPLAAALARTHGVDAQSAGLDADRGDPATPEAQYAAERRGADLSSHEARNVYPGLIREATRVYAMTDWHAQQLIRRYPQYAERIRVLDPPIPDPYGRDAAAYEECASALLAAMHNAGILDYDSHCESKVQK